MPSSRRTRLWAAAAVALALVLALLAAGPGRDPLLRLTRGVRPGVTLAGRPIGGMYRGEVQTLLHALWKESYRAPVDAGVDPATGAIIPERPGEELNVGRTLGLVMAAPRRGQVDPVFETLPARWTAADLGRLTAVAGQYTTWAYGSPERWFNIGKALRALNNTLLYPGQTFSFMDRMPPFTAREGWKTAKVIVWGEAAEGIGGGVCQVSSTLYNAVRRAHLKVVERHAHAKAVPYVPPGCDATVAAYPRVDFRFRNDSDRPVLIRAGLEGGAVRVRILTIPPTPPSR